MDEMGYYFMILCKLILFSISNLGLWEYFRRKSGMNVYFLPAFTISLQVTVLFCAGILNCLELAVLLMYGAGILFAVYYLCTDFKSVVHAYWNVGYLFLAVSVCVLLLACRGRVFGRYDNFTHWALVVKNMLLTDRFPTFQDTMVKFQEYPLGSASYIYYFVKVVSDSESFQMVAQGFMMLSFILPVIKCLRRNMLIGGIYFGIFVNYILCFYAVSISDLLIDTLLPLQGMSMLFFIYSECINMPDENNPGDVSLLYAIPFLCTTVQIKNSGIYFVVLACILIALSMKKDKPEQKPVKSMNLYRIITMAAPFISLYIWHKHCKYVFYSASVSAHAMTFQNYKSVFSQKTEDDITAILVEVFKFSIGGEELYNLLLFIGIFGVLSFLGGVKLRNQYLKVVLVCTVIYITYMAGTAAMYLFSMPSGEAENLAGVSRYRSTVFIAIYYLFLLFSMVIISSIESMRRDWFCLVGIYAALFIVWGRENGEPFPTIFDYTPDGTRGWIEEVIEEYNVPSGSSCLILAPDANTAGFMWGLCNYILWSDNVSAMVITEKLQLDESAGSFQYIFLRDVDNPLIQEWVKENYPEQEGESVISR